MKYQDATAICRVFGPPGDSVGNRVFPPINFTGGGRYHVMNYQDVMVICRVFGAPNLFITFTCNGGGDAMAICRVFGAPDLFITFTCNSGDDTTKTKSTVSPTDATGVLPHPSPTETKNITTKMRSHASNSCKATKKLFPVESTEDAERDSVSQVTSPRTTNDE